MGPEVEIERPVPIYQQIAEQLEEQILTGLLKPGQKLPSTQEYAARFGVAVRTVQRSMDILARRTLITRKPKEGSFVNLHVQSKAVGLLVGTEVFMEENSRFHQLLLCAIRRLAAKRGWHPVLYIIDSRSSLAASLPAINADVQSGRIRGIIAINSKNYIDELSLGCTFPWSTTRGRVDYADLASQCVRHLLERGYRDIAVIRKPDPSDPRGERQRRAARRAFADYQVKPPPNWDLVEASVGREGLAAIRRLLQSRAAPKAVAVMNDGAAEGVIMGLLEAGKHIPQDVALITHANRGIPILSPVELTRVEYAVEEFAAIALDSFESVLSGADAGAHPEIVGCLVQGAST